MSRAAWVGGIALILFTVLYLASFLLASPLVGVEDGDNPASSLAFIRQHAGVFFLSGVANVLTAIALTTAVLSVSDLGRRPSSSLLERVASAFGWFAAAYFFANGVLRMQSPGTLVYMTQGTGHGARPRTSPFRWRAPKGWPRQGSSRWASGR